MFFLNDSLTVVLVGDWNKLYIQPNWMAENVYEKEEMEIGVNGKGLDLTVSYKCDNVVISPEQSRITFSVANTDTETLKMLSRCINNFLEKAYTTALLAYGINGDFVEEDGSSFAEVLDSMSDSSALVGNGYEIISTEISRALLKNGKIINMDSKLEHRKVNIHFNEHHSNPVENPNFSVDVINEFINECYDIVKGLGYDLEVDE